EAMERFHLMLERASAGATEEETEAGLRRCLYLDPHLAQARYLLALLLEQRGELVDAAIEYRRAGATLREDRARRTHFFLNNERLKAACDSAVRRLDGQG